MSDEDTLKEAAAQARGLAIDAVEACSSGHLGLPLGCAEIGAVLFGDQLEFHPQTPKWLNRDRFILSAGHGSMFLYSWLHLSGYAVSREDLADFRKLHSVTPGHPEYGETAGVEATTGPLGQGVGNAVGYALSGKRAAARFNTAEHTVFDHHVVTLAGDGCLQEGVARESISFAAHAGLDNLILIYDSNQVTLDAMAEVTQSEDVEKYFQAIGWEVQSIDGHDLKAIQSALATAKSNHNGKPHLIIAETEIGRGIPEVAGTQKAHGEGGAKLAQTARQGLGLPAEERFYVSDEVREFFEKRKEAAEEKLKAWQKTFEAWLTANPDLAKELQGGLAQALPIDFLQELPKFDDDYSGATRQSGGVVINQIADYVPQLLTGSADLFGSTKNYLKEKGDFSKESPEGRNIWFGIREHAMGAISNGIAYDGLFRISTATFLVFADYMRPSIRLAALANLPVIYVFTHDSVGVGEDGPTHQPVETVSGLRVIPNLDVIRPGDAEEVVGAWAAAMMRSDGPTALILSRQGVPMQKIQPVKERRHGTVRGAYVLKKETEELSGIIIATGSELELAMEAAAELGDGIRVVSMPCMERFERQNSTYQDEVLPPSCSKRVAVEAGVSALWWKHVGGQGQVVAIDRFGLSAPGKTAMTELGLTKQAIIDALS